MNIKKSIISLLSLCLMAVALGSCEDNVDLTKEKRAKNEQAFLSYAKKTDYQKVSLAGLYADSYVYMKWLSKKHEGAKPRQTDLVKMHYSGYFLTEWSKDTNARPFDSNTDLAVLQAGPVNGYIEGMQIALQNMSVGDKVGVIIPWYLGYGQGRYGAYGQVEFPGYKALYFEVELKEIIER